MIQHINQWSMIIYKKRSSYFWLYSWGKGKKSNGKASEIFAHSFILILTTFCCHVLLCRSRCSGPQIFSLSRCRWYAILIIVLRFQKNWNFRIRADFQWEFLSICGSAVLPANPIIAKIKIAAANMISTIGTFAVTRGTISSDVTLKDSKRCLRSSNGQFQYH